MKGRKEKTRFPVQMQCGEIRGPPCSQAFPTLDCISSKCDPNKSFKVASCQVLGHNTEKSNRAWWEGGDKHMSTENVRHK